MEFANVDSRAVPPEKMSKKQNVHRKQTIPVGNSPPTAGEKKGEEGKCPPKCFFRCFFAQKADKQRFGYEAFFSAADTASSTYRSLVLINVKRRVAFLVPKTHALYSHLESLRIVGKFYCLHKGGEKGDVNVSISDFVHTNATPRPAFSNTAFGSKISRKFNLSCLSGWGPNVTFCLKCELSNEKRGPWSF